MARSPAYEKHPDHKIVLEPSPVPVRVEFGGETVARSSRALRCLEGSYPPVVYIPRDDVRTDLIEKTDHSTYCPFKGHASYYTIRVGDRVSENAIWSYEDPYDQVAELKDCAAFYLDRVDALIEEEAR
jgi:uncharacterized protein (DUF427 family)